MRTLLCSAIGFTVSGCSVINLHLEPACDLQTAVHPEVAVVPIPPRPTRRLEQIKNAGQTPEPATTRPAYTRLKLALSPWSGLKKNSDSKVAAQRAELLINSYRDYVEPLLAASERNDGRPATVALSPLSFPDFRVGAEVAASNGFVALAVDNLTAITARGVDADALEFEANVALFLQTYFNAYFRNGDVFQADLNFKEFSSKSAAKLSQELTLPAGLSPEQTEEIRNALKKEVENQLPRALAELCQSTTAEDCLLTKALGTERFVTKAGLAVQFAGVTATFGKAGQLKPNFTYPAATEFGPQMARVGVEALFDAYYRGGPPAMATATACNEPNGTPLYSGAGQCLGRNDTDAKTQSDTANAAAAYEDANKVEAAVTSLAAQMLRGVNIAALNNEALAKTLETGFGVTARKLAERISWKARSCAENRLTYPSVTATIGGRP